MVTCYTQIELCYKYIISAHSKGILHEWKKVQSIFHWTHATKKFLANGKKVVRYLEAITLNTSIAWEIFTNIHKMHTTIAHMTNPLSLL